jgi:putative tricarboxylic transport membrane protein
MYLKTVKAHDQVSSLFWLLVSIYASIESIQMGVGTLQKPGMGFITFGTSVLLGILSLALFVRTTLRRKHAKTEPLFAGKLWKRVLLVLVALLIYAKLMPMAGYLVSTFFLMSFLFWIVKGQKWWWVLISSFLTTLITYYVFSIWLKGQLPEGFIGL